MILIDCDLSLPVFFVWGGWWTQMDIRVNPGKINGWKPKSHGMSWFRSMLIFCSAFLSYSPTGTSFPRGGLGEAGVFENSADAQQQDTFQGGRVFRGFGGGSFFFPAAMWLSF